MTSNMPTKSLQETTSAVKNASTAQEKASYLDQAFELFKQETEKLAAAYWNLQKKFEAVNVELQTSNEKLNKKVVELNFITNYMDSILNQMSQGLVFVDLTGTITTYNKAAEELIGVNSERVLLRSFWSIFPDELFGFSLRKALGSKATPNIIFATIKGRNNESREVEVNTNFIQQNGAQGIIILFRDITELRQLQIIASRNDRLKELGEMAAMVAHEIRNPLGGIKGFASLLERDLKEHPEMAKMAGYIIEGTNTLNRLVNAILNYSRPVQLRLESTNLVALMNELVEHILADSSISPTIKIGVEASKQEITAPTDPAIIKGAILNLVVNSIQAMPDGGRISIVVDEALGHAIIQVVDTGVGISPENLNKLFSPFFTTRSEGNGFGLAEVHKVVQAHGGTIEAESIISQGTSFTLKLPLQIGKKHGN